MAFLVILSPRGGGGVIVLSDFQSLNFKLRTSIGMTKATETQKIAEPFLEMPQLHHFSFFATSFFLL